MAQVVSRYFGQNFLVTQTGGSHDGGVDVWVARRCAVAQGEDPHNIVYECAVQVKRYQALLSDASVRDFAEKIALKAKRGIFIAPGGFGASAMSFAEGKGSWLGGDNEKWLQLWDARTLRKKLCEFGDDWCNSVLASRPTPRAVPRAPVAPMSPGRGRYCAGKAAAEAAAYEDATCPKPGVEDGAGAEGASSMHRRDGTLSGDDGHPHDVSAHGEAEAGEEEGGKSAPVPAAPVPATSRAFHRPPVPSSPNHWGGVNQGAHQGAGARTPLKAQPARLNAGGAGGAGGGSLGAEVRSSKRTKFDEQEVSLTRGKLCRPDSIPHPARPFLSYRTRGSHSCSWSQISRSNIKCGGAACVTRRCCGAQELEIYCYLVAERQGTLATPDSDSDTHNTWATPDPIHHFLPPSITSSKVLQGLLDRFPGVTLHMHTHRVERTVL
jgi:hypothetical protein